MQTREVLLRIGLPNGASPELRLRDQETGTVSLPDVGTFGFLPVVHNDDSVTVTVLDLTNGQRKQMADVSLSSGDVLTTDTTPKFSIRMVHVDRAPIPLKLIGVLEQDNKRAAILLDRKGQPTFAREGETVLGQYKLLTIGVTSVTMSYLDGTGVQEIQMARK
jgi:hypothetical protein